MLSCFVAGVAFTAVAAAPPPPEGLRLLTALKGHASGGPCIAFAPHGNLLASASFRSDLKRPRRGRRFAELKLWDLTTGKQQATWEGHQDGPEAIAFSPDGKTLVSITSDLEAIHWNVATGQAALSRPQP